MARKKMCYWCGGPATTKEHVPSKGLFPAGKSVNLITVPSCETHNNLFSTADEKFRFYLQVRESSADALSEFKDRTYRGLTKKEATKFVANLAANSIPVEVDGQKTFLMKIDPAEQYGYFEKIIRGLYYHLYKKPATGRVVSVSRDFLVPGLDYHALYSHLAQFKELLVVGKTSNPDIFRFQYYQHTENSREAFYVVMTFYDGVEVLGFITPPQ